VRCWLVVFIFLGEMADHPDPEMAIPVSLEARSSRIFSDCSRSNR